MEELSGKRNKVSYTALLALVTGIMTCYLAFFKLRLGLRGDDIHMMVTADAILRGSRYVKDNFSLFQFVSFFLVPLERLFIAVNGSTEGLVKYYRIVFVVFQGIVAFICFFELRHHIPERSAFIASVIIFAYVPYCYSIYYKTLPNWFIILSIILVLSYSRSPNLYKLILIGLAISASAVSFETSVIMVIPLSYAVYYVKRDNKKKAMRAVFAVWVTCILAAIVFFAFLAHETGGARYLPDYLKFIISDEWHTESIIDKLPRMLLPLCLCFLVSAVAVIADKKLNKVKTDTLVFIFLVLAAVILVIMRPASVSINRVNYLFAILFCLDLLLISRFSKEKRKELFAIYVFPTIFFFASVILATNLGFAMASCSFITAAILFAVISEQQEICIPNSAKLIAAVTVIAGLILIPVSNPNPSNATVFAFNSSSRVISSGVCKGIYPMDDTAKNIDDLHAVMEKHVTENDNLLLFDMYAYMDGKQKVYSTNSLYAKTPKVVDFYSLNPDIAPTITIISYQSEEQWSSFLKDDALGRYIQKNAVFSLLDGEYMIVRFR